MEWSLLKVRQIVRSSMDAGKTVIAFSISWTGSHAGSGEMPILTKNAVSYSMADLVGTWQGNSIASGPGTPWWERGTMTIKPDGTFMASTSYNDGSQGKAISGTFTISPEGAITFPDSTVVISIDADKTVMVWTDTWTHGFPGSTEIKVLTKMATQVSSACAATLDKKLLLNIPYLSYVTGTLSLWADLLYEFNPTYPTLIPFKLTNGGILNNPSFLCAASTLSNDLKIHIPDVLFPDGITHLWVDLEYSLTLSIGGNFYWVVSNYGIL